MKSVLTSSIDTKVLETFTKHCLKKGYTKSSIIQQIIIDYLEFGLREFSPNPRSKNNIRQIDKSQNEVSDISC